MSALIDPDLKALAVHQFCHGLRCEEVGAWDVTFEDHGCIRDGFSVPTCDECLVFLREDHDVCPECQLRDREHNLTIKEATPVE